MSGINANFILLSICFFQISQINGLLHSKEIFCERFYSGNWIPLKNETFTVCDMKIETEIYEPNVKISNFDDSVLSLTFYTNRNIFYLPIDVAKSFPNLTAFGADETSIKEISKENFRNLRKLRCLTLVSNKIEMIFSDTFEDLESLEVLWLGKRKLIGKNCNKTLFVCRRK